MKHPDNTLLNCQFGNWKIINYDYEKSKSLKRTYYFCECQCENHTIKSICLAELKRGKSKSCGCLTKQLLREKILKDLKGMKFGKLTVLELDSYAKDRHAIWKCQCECGNITFAKSNNLQKGITSSCGCYRKELGKKNFKDLTNQKFGKLTAVKPIKIEGHSNYYWECNCDCGNTATVLSSNLISGTTQSCGCLNSKGEKKVTDILKENKIIFKKQFSFNDLINPQTNYKLFFDFAIFDDNNNLQYLIEYDGEQHFLKSPQGYFTQDLIDKIHYLDKLKDDYCISHNIPLIRIPYTNYDKLTIKDLVL